MKSYTITVNGNVYDVTVEENTNGAPAAAPAPKQQHRLRLRQQNRQQPQAQQEAFPSQQAQQVKLLTL